MTSDTLYSYAPPQTAERNLLGVIAFAGLLLLLFVGMDPFSPPAAVSQFGGAPEASRGDILRQLLFLAVAMMTGLAALQRQGLGALRAIPVSMALLLAWCVASAMWAPEQGVVLRRAGLQVIIVGSLLLSIENVGAERAFTYWRVLLGIVLVINLVSIPLIANARHGAGEIDPALVGNWRGLYGHKNIAGAICAMTVLTFLFTRTGKRNWIGLLAAAGAFFFLLMSHSKSSLGFLPIAALAGLAYRAGWRDGLSRALLVTAVALLAVAMATFIILDADTITRLLEDPREFTGRAAIWAAEIAYIKDHPLLGNGFGTFADAGGLSPLHGYVSGSWVEEVSHGHNGFLQVLVTVGGIGFALTIIAAVLLPLRRFWDLDEGSNNFKPLLFALFTFLVLRNFMESDLLEGGSAWATLVMVVAALGWLQRHPVR